MRESFTRRWRSRTRLTLPGGLAEVRRDAVRSWWRRSEEWSWSWPVADTACVLAEDLRHGPRSDELVVKPGSLFSEARGNQTVRHEHLRNGTVYGKSFFNGAMFQTDRYNPLINNEERATIQNGVGTITSASQNCSDRITYLSASQLGRHIAPRPSPLAVGPSVKGVTYMVLVSWSRRTLVTVVVVGSVAVSGCSSDEPGATAQSTSPVEQISSAERIGQCLNDQGWDVTYSAIDDSLEYVINQDQKSSYDAAFQSCEEEFGEEVIAYADFTQEMWDDLYELESATADCLRDVDIVVPAIPSEATFIERYQSSDPWTSYGFVDTGALSSSEWEQLNESCPQPGR